MRNDDYPDPTPQSVTWSVALGVGPLPFLAVYSVLFIAHGFIYPVNPPDITGSRNGEAIAGIVAFVLFIVGTLVVWWFLNGTRRWPFVLGQLATLGTCIDFIIDRTTGSPAVPLLLALTSAGALTLAALPSGWAHTGFEPASRRPRSKGQHPQHRPEADPETEDASFMFGPTEVDAAVSELSR
jgi:hypothetical protein